MPNHYSDVTIAGYRYCDFGHLMTLHRPPLLAANYYGHVYETEAIECAGWVAQGWPAPNALP